MQLSSFPQINEEIKICSVAVSTGETG